MIGTPDAVDPTTVAHAQTLSDADSPVIRDGQLHKRSPLDLSALPPVGVTPIEEVSAIVAHARAGQPAWAALGFKGRAKALRALAKRMLVEMDEVVELMRVEAGKLDVEAVMTEAVGPLEFVKAWIPLARGPLTKPQKLAVPTLAFPGKSARMIRVPRGVVGVITPWNFPLGVFYKPVVPALLAGNSVVLKPSEQTPRVAAWFARICAEVLPSGVVELVQGGAEQGTELLQHVDAVDFTGSVDTGRRVGAICGERLIPCSLELGGKDPAIVLPDCDEVRTAAGVTAWALHNYGQNCGAIERLYVVEDGSGFADRFVKRLTSAWSRLRAGVPTQGEGEAVASIDIGPLNNPQQLALVEAHVKDAVDKGATILTGGSREGCAGYVYPPTLLADCTHDMLIMTEETFGPVLPIQRVQSIDEAIQLANDSRFGLNASIWSDDRAAAKEHAKRLDVGTVFINNHAISGAIASCPWTGTKDSANGVASSVLALDHFTRPKVIFTDRSKAADPFWYPIDATLHRMSRALRDVQLGNFRPRVLKQLLAGALGRSKTILAFFRKTD